MKTFKKIMKWIGIVLGGLILVVIIMRIILDVVFGMELRQTLRDLKAQGVPLTIAEFAPLPVPDADNAAPLLNKAMALILPQTNTSPSALKSLVAIIDTNYIPGKVCIDITGWTEAQREEGAKLIQSKEVKEWYAILEKAALRPRYGNNPDWSQGPSMRLPNLGKYRTMFRVLAIKAAFEGQSGNTNQAFDTILTGLEINNKLKDEPTLITQLVRVACDMILIDELERLANVSEIPKEQTHLLMTELSLSTDAAPWVKSIDSERIGMGMWVYDLTMHASAKDLMPLLSCMSDSRISYSDARILAWIIPVVRPVFKKDMVIYHNLMSKTRHNFEVPYYQIADTIKQSPRENRIPQYAVITCLTYPNLDILRQRVARYQAEAEVCRVGLALKLYKQKSGTYPDTLDRLTPEFMESIPVDPFTGKPLVYRKTGDGFLLYSLGPNLKDDGGKPGARSGKATEDSDIVWKCGR